MTDNTLLDEQGLGPLTTNAFGEQYFFNINRTNFDKVSAQALFDSKFADVLFNDDSLNIVIGTDSGLLPRYVQSKTLAKGSRYIFIEPEEVLQALQSSQLLANLDERIVCISLQQWAKAARDFKITDYFYINGVRSCNAICAQDDYINQYAELSWHITEVLSQCHWQTAMELGSEAFITKQIANIADNRLPAKALQQAFTGKTVLLMAGGPSLDQALPWVKQHRDKLVVFAVSRIARQCLAAGIDPDFVFSVDPTELSFDISKEMLNFGDSTTFVCSYHTVPTLLNQWLGRVLYLGARLPWESPLNVPNLSSAGPTVTNTALSIAHKFGFKRIILAGVDLCFTREGVSHAKGSNEDMVGPKFNLTSLQVETNGGFMAPTRVDFIQAIKSLSMQAKIIAASGCEIINIGEGSAKVEYVKYQPLAEIVVDDADAGVAAIIEAKLPKQAEQAYFKQILDELRRAQYQIKTINQLAEEARQINDEMYQQHGTVVNFKDKKQLDRIEKKLKREYRRFSRLIKKFGIRRLIRLTKPFNDDEWTAEEVKQLGNAYYDAYAQGASKLLSIVNDAVARVEVRIQEYGDAADFALIIEQARKDRSYGRVRLWRKLHPTAEQNPELKLLFAEFEQNFADVLNQKNTKHLAIVKQHSHLTAAKQRSAVLYRHKKVDELQNLQSALSKHADQQAAAPYLYLVSGYLAELQDDLNAALDAYQQVVDVGDVLLEEALMRIAGIGIEANDNDTAYLALQCLAQINPLYLPLYAEMQRLHGEVLPAIDTFNDYIGRFPADTLAQLKLVTLYMSAQIYEAAEMLLEFILQQKPNLEAAMGLKQQLQRLRLAAS